MAKSVKLGKHATMFFDPTLNLKVLPGETVELPKDWRKGKLTQKALNAGHLKYTSKEEVEEEEEEKEENLKSIDKMNKAELTAYILENDEDYQEDDLDLKKSELKEIAEAIAQ